MVKMVLLSLSCLFLVAITQGVHGSDWTTDSPQDGAFVYACAGDTFTIPWNYLLSSGDVLGDVQWFFDGQSQEMVAMASHGHFFAEPAFGQRVEAVGNAGISIRKAVVADSGNYSVEVNGYDSTGVHFVLRRSVQVVVHDRLMTTDGQLHVTQRSEAVLDPDTDQWAIQLQCGTFTFKDNPPFPVEWTTPDRQTVNSSDFSDHHFHLLLKSPVQGGNYSCRIPPQHADDACLHGTGHRGEATTMVDKTDVRLTLLEAENRQLKHNLEETESKLSKTNSSLQNNVNSLATENQQLKQKLEQTESKLIETKNNFTMENQQLKQQLLQTNDSLTQENQVLKQQLQQTNSDLAKTTADLAKTNSSVSQLEVAAHQRVAFQARYLHNNHPPSGTPIAFTDVQYNQGNAYNHSSGYFTTPYPGIYYFIATTGSAESNHGADHYLFVDSTMICSSYTYRDGHYHLSSVHAVLHLNPGQRVWIRGDGSYYYNAYASVFSGFLLSHDP